jgi:hypothetical protein
MKINFGILFTLLIKEENRIPKKIKNGIPRIRMVEGSSLFIHKRAE